ncbi:hypothetical protein SAMN05216232_1360 [Virgibacillus subterraneus]|uniref:Uncharacterized protein n=2 Tax=Virgibacillus subterraneus TaxID=621109 RepID=A0A1H9BWA9_9BACI|nr:hypothetical protein SAMN05216232_1360 [Virgibacillus subterraneus]
MKMAKSQETGPIDQEEPEEDSSPKHVKQEKYAEGIVELEDGDSITVDFDAYGNRTFTNFFTTLEYLI